MSLKGKSAILTGAPTFARDRAKVWSGWAGDQAQAFGHRP